MFNNNWSWVTNIQYYLTAIVLYTYRILCNFNRANRHHMSGKKYIYIGKTTIHLFHIQYINSKMSTTGWCHCEWQEREYAMFPSTQKAKPFISSLELSGFKKILERYNSSPQLLTDTATTLTVTMQLQNHFRLSCNNNYTNTKCIKK